MADVRFLTDSGIEIPSVDEAQMRAVDRVAVDDFGLGILQMMENAGRSLALSAMMMAGPASEKSITVVAGTGGNGGGGLCAARHLHNHGHQVQVLLTKPAVDYRRAAAAQLNTLINAGVKPTPTDETAHVLSNSDIILDALIGYSLKGPPDGPALELIQTINQSPGRVISLDLPSGVNATSGETPGQYVRADQTLTLALPKPGLSHPDAGEIFLADIGIPPQVYQQLGIHFNPFFGNDYLLKLTVLR